ncbi:hypothetical protein C5S30_00335 [ANME-1 cluster archaeon GoMg4]|nr:hypothetical protein [ANME-1 cluster archaeon GoMg4]
MGPGVSHKVAIVRPYIERKTHTEIERTLKHSLTAIKRYILTFSRVAYLTEKGYTTKEIAFLPDLREIDEGISGVIPPIQRRPGV